MPTNKSSHQNWQKYIATELALLTPLLQQRGYRLSEQQPHIAGERFLMQNLTTTGGKKMILLGQHITGDKVVIKATRDQAGKHELTHERQCRQSLHALDFAYSKFYSPSETDFFSSNGFLVSIQKFIDQPLSFLERPLEQQFSYALAALKIQEGARATTKSHYRTIARVFGIRTSADYEALFAGFLTYLNQGDTPLPVMKNMIEVRGALEQNHQRIEQYCGFLTHTDFVPHNFRIADSTLYLLDFSSLQFGNKHESWARFLNFMTLYNPELEALLIQYIEDNRAPEERESLQLMRVYRLGEIITYYTKTLEQSTGTLAELNRERILFWNSVLSAELANERVAQAVVTEYKKVRDGLRSEAEKQRQIGLH